MKAVLAASALILGVAGAASAQATAATALALGGIDKLLDRIETINIYYGGNLSSRDNKSGPDLRVPWNRNYGLEFGFHVADFGDYSPEKKQEITRKADSLYSVYLSRKAYGGVPKVARDSADTNAKKPAFDVTSITVKKHLSLNWNGDTVLVSVDSELVGNWPKPKGDKLIEFDLGIGYGQLDGVTMATPYELRGYVRELPTVTLYGTVRLHKYFGLYTGVRTGVITLQDAQLFVPRDTTTLIYSLSATTFGMGVPFGLDLRLTKDIHITLELDYMRRKFNSVSFNPATNIPAGYPHSIDMSGGSFSFGVQFPLPKKQ